MKLIKINVTKIDKTLLFRGEKGIYLDCVTLDQPDRYGNDGIIAQSIPKARREAGEQGPEIGTWRELGRKSPTALKHDAQMGKVPMSAAMREVKDMLNSRSPRKKHQYGLIFPDEVLWILVPTLLDCVI